MLFADPSTSAGGSGYTSILLIGGFAVLVYFLMIRPQQRRRREVQSMQSAMGPGDEIITVGGLYGTIRTIDDESVLLEIAPGVTARYARAAIGKVTSKAEQTATEEETSDAEPLDGETPATGTAVND